MRIYELILVLKTSLSAVEKKKIMGEIEKSLKGFKFIKENDWGKKELAFKIKRETEGQYLSISMEGESIPAGFERKLSSTDEILRHLLIREK